MEIKGKVHCFFEQSGTFKNDFYWRWYKRWLKIAQQFKEAK